MADDDDHSVAEMKAVVSELREIKDAISFARNQNGVWQMPAPALPAEHAGWNFTTFEKYINQRFSDIALQLRERYEAQQTGLSAALAAAEKAVTAALIAAEKAVDKAERAQELRNQVANEFRQSLQDLSSLMWTIKEGTEAVNSLRREIDVTQKAVEKRVNTLETGYANIQGRIWAVSALFALIALGLEIGSRFIGR